jgi:hypothetical protein
MGAGGGAAGTVPYIAPECFAAGGPERVSEKSDIYSLGIIMWECLTQQVGGRWCACALRVCVAMCRCVFCCWGRQALRREGCWCQRRMI